MLSHFNIAGYERADQLAKEAATLKGEASLMHYQCTECYPLINKEVQTCWQKICRRRIIINLEILNLMLNPCASAKNKVPRIEIIMAWLRIGH